MRPVGRAAGRGAVRPVGRAAGRGAGQPRLVRAYRASFAPSWYTRVKWSLKYDRRAGVQAMRRLLNRTESHTYRACRNALVQYASTAGNRAAPELASRPCPSA